MAAIAAGANHGLALTTHGRLLVWGLNSAGQLGTGTTANSPTPVEILTGIATAAGGGAHSLAIRDDGTVLAWGNNSFGQIGDGTTANRLSPVVVTGFGNALTPPAPSALTATAVSAVRIDLAWRDNSGNETGFQLERKIGAGGTWSLRATLGANVTAYADLGLTPATTYVYRLRAINGSGASAYTSEVTRATPALPIAPANLSATVATAAAITLTWQDRSSDEAAFAIERQDGTAGDWLPLTTTPANTTAYADISVAEQTLYHYRVRATNWTGPSAWSNEASATTPALPLAPSDLAATQTTASRVDLSWQDNSSDEAGFKIERQIADSGTWTQIATDVADTTRYADTTVSAGPAYRYRVRGYNWTGDSPYSNEAGANYQLVVTATAGANGNISPAARSVAYGATTSFTVTPDTGYSASVSGCGGSLSGSIYTTGAITDVCEVSATFVPVVITVAASDKTATEAGLTTGRYTFTRAGSIAAALTVNYGVSGTATAGRDYTALGTSVSFPANVAKVTKTVTPLQDSRVEIDESIILTLIAGTGYAVGTSASGTVILKSDD